MTVCFVTFYVARALINSKTLRQDLTYTQLLENTGYHYHYIFCSESALQTSEAWKDVPYRTFCISAYILTKTIK